MDNNSIQIDRYLQGEMSEAEKQEFENKLAADKNLQQELHIQQQVIMAVENAGIKNEFAKAIKKRWLRLQFIRWGIILGVAILAFLFYAYKNNLFTHGEKVKEKVTTGTLALPESSNSSAADTIIATKDSSSNRTVNLPSPERFDINTATDTIIETKDGLVLAIPAGAFNTNAGAIHLEIKTALNALDIMRYGLSTMSDNNLLRTAGMFSINAIENGKPLQMRKDISVSIPATETDNAMQLFDGVEDSSGIINWVNPKPIEKSLRTYDISQLDFYPPNYMPTLKALQKNYKNKKYTDSLYYSFSGYPLSEKVPAAIMESAIKKPYVQQSNNISVPDNQINNNEPLKPDSLLSKPLRDTMSFAIKAPVGIDYSDSDYIYQVDPAKIKAIWQPKFNNTIIATKEFEERLRYIHSLCMDGYLEAYLENLDKPMYKTDELLARKSEGAVKKKFLEFAKRKDGGVMLANGLQKKLSDYFYQKSKAYREAAEQTWAKYQDSLDKLNKIADVKRRKAEINNFRRENNNFNEELCINLTDAYRQLGIKRTCNDKTVLPPPARYYTVPVSTPGWKNLDAYVYAATKNRQSMEYKDQGNGKTVMFAYKEVDISITNREQFDRVVVYLIPDGLPSFQRIEENENSFKGNLNALLKYDVIVLAWKGEQSYFFKQQLLQPGKYIFSLTAVNANGLKGLLKDYSLIKSTDVITDFEYQLFEQKEIERQLLLRKDIDFRSKIAEAIYPCIEGSLNSPVQENIEQ